MLIELGWVWVRKVRVREWGVGNFVDEEVRGTDEEFLNESYEQRGEGLTRAQAKHDDAGFAIGVMKKS